MHLLLVGLNYAPEPVGIAVYSAGLAEAMVARGHRVTAVVGEPYYPEWKRHAGARRGWSSAVENGVRVIRCPHYIPATPSGAKRLVHHATFAAAALAPALKAAGQRPDAVFTVAPSLASAPIARAAAQRAGSPLWLHIQDFEVEAAAATGLLAADGRALQVARGLERRLLASADVVSTISPQMIASLRGKGVPEGRLYELRNWADDAIDWAAAGRGEAMRRELGLGPQKVALYSGNIANKQGLECVIEAAAGLRGRDDLAFLICGQGPNRAPLEALARDLPNVRFADLQPRERLGELLALASVHLLPQIAGAADLMLPSKLTNMLASGMPTVACAAPGTGLAAEVEGCGLVVPPGDGAAMANAVACLLDEPALADRLGAAARQRAHQRWSREVILDRFEQRLGQMAAAR